MEFQQGMTLLTAAVSSGMGAAVVWGMTREKVSNLEKSLKEMRDGAVWKDTCVQCQNKWAGHVGSITDDIRRIDDKLDRILERLK